MLTPRKGKTGRIKNKLIKNDKPKLEKDSHSPIALKISSRTCLHVKRSRLRQSMTNKKNFAQELREILQFQIFHGKLTQGKCSS